MPVWLEPYPANQHTLDPSKFRNVPLGEAAIFFVFLEAYGMNWDEFPLLMLRPGNWEKPFVALAEGSG